MDHSVHNRTVSFIWSIADDCLRDVYVRGKYRDVILPMFVLRRLDCLLEPSKETVEEEVKFQREEAGFTELDPTGLREASGYIFYNTSPWTLQRLVDTATNTASILEQNFNAYLNGFSSGVVEIIDRFKLREQVKHMSEKDVLLDVLEKFTNKYINLTPNEAWINIDQTKIGYEISFNKYFYRHKPLRSLEEVTADILKLETETEGLLKKRVSFSAEQYGPSN